MTAVESVHHAIIDKLFLELLAQFITKLAASMQRLLDADKIKVVTDDGHRGNGCGWPSLNRPVAD